MGETHHVALADPGDSDRNTIVLPGVDLVVPLERDLDDDPLQDDEVRLRSHDGSYEVILRVDDPDVDHDDDNRLLLFNFRGVPPGIYDASVCSGGSWSDVLHGIVVTQTGALHEGTALGASPSVQAAPADSEPTDEEPDEAEAADTAAEHLELLEVADVEGPRAARRTGISFRVVNAAAPTEALPHVQVHVTFPDGSVQTFESDGDGIVRIDSSDSGEYQVTPLDQNEVLAIDA